MASKVYERTLEETPTWAVAVVGFVLVVISIFIEHIIHLIGKWCKNKHKRALYEAVEKVKAELMLLGFLSLLLTVGQEPISGICISESVGATWHPCAKKEKKETDTESDSKGRKLLQFLEAEPSLRRMLATKGYDKCAEKGKVAFVSAYGIHQLHIFIFVLAVFHILYCITTLALGRTKMRKWKVWEDETKTLEHKFYIDTERFRFTRDTTFGRRHLNFWSQSSVSLWIVSFFRQFFGSVSKVDYMTLRHGFIMAHLAPGSESRFDFQKYISRSLEEDFKVVVGVSPIMWLFALLFLLSNTHGWNSYLWLPFIPLIIILLVGAKLQMIITKMGVKIQERGAVVMGAPVVQPGDDLFWFNRPRLVLFFIHFVLFQNAFQLAFFAWSTYEFTINSCFHHHTADIVIRLTLGVVIHVVCSYVTLPLYALVTQMGSTMKPTIFNDRVAAALKNWHHTAKKHVKHSRQSEPSTPLSSMPASPRSGMSPVHLLQNYRGHSDSLQSSPRFSKHGNEHWDAEGSISPHKHTEGNKTQSQVQEPSSTQLPLAPPPNANEHEINISVSNFSFKRP
ncbi:MLO-like protein [Quillaja saponaria]|uniref:MLO-like protein n=1 Tax=Quillaja saponaria TaxID=32244 RepID=A0AAD7VGY6_QUISA|nr:MLO-like protein [Quillaja saponaria]